MTKDDQLVLSKSNSWRMFNQISPRYDFLNHFLSFGLDIRWRKILAQFLPPRKKLQVLDLATGTADVLISFVKHNKKIEHAYGIDMAQNMLDVGRSKIQNKNLDKLITLKYGNINQIPFEDNSFDATSIAFGIRNVDDPTIVLREMYRVLKKKGRTMILEFSLPENNLIKNLHLFYLRNLVPIIGFIFSGHYKAYKYLNQTIETFPYGANFCTLMRNEGFKRVNAHPLMFGIATIYIGEK